MHKIIRQLAETGVLPILVEAGDPGLGAPLCDALTAGGLPVLEVTLRSPGGLEVIRRIRQERPAFPVGAGTVLTPAQARAALDAGARFLVSPGLDPDLVALAQAAGVPIVPGVCTPTEVQAALKLGLETLKFFPAAVMGGPAMLKQLAGPYPTARFVVTGGVSENNLAGFLPLTNVLACGGAWMLGGHHLDPDLATVTARARAAAEAAQACRQTPGAA